MPLSANRFYIRYIVQSTVDEITKPLVNVVSIKLSAHMSAFAINSKIKSTWICFDRFLPLGSKFISRALRYARCMLNNASNFCCSFALLFCSLACIGTWISR